MTEVVEEPSAVIKAALPLDELIRERAILDEQASPDEPSIVDEFEPSVVSVIDETENVVSGDAKLPVINTSETATTPSNTEVISVPDSDIELSEMRVDTIEATEPEPVDDTREVISLNKPELPAELPILAEEAQESTIREWEYLLYQEPDQVFEGFVQAFQGFADIAQHTADNESHGFNADVEPPALFIELGVQLEVLELKQKLEIEPLVLEIVGTIHGIHILEMEGNTEAALLAKESLEELCIVLLDKLGIEYDQNELEQLIGIFLSSEFSPRNSIQADSTPEIDLENSGTHEAKRFDGLVALYGDIEDHLQKSLGKLALHPIHLAYS